ncbi:Thiol-disulfide oxidoreductase ResA [Gimesia panareensis]|uniref:Thiol-disulfide oxidoreductase ResA n=1 Tax=Gimesia panareensis TaxID=2527978 RepID=A0A517Q9V4_9PLAN|nr:TlpA disulfide reductase family protein [Gimesia panareensis]QDT28385.1 Thiol-disulfide oxidoreductase ResA [Gimesia panareensis]
MLRCVASMVVFAILGSVASIQADDFQPRPLKPAEAELVDLVKKMYAEYERIYTQAEKIKDKQERDKYFADHDPSAKYVALLTEFERTHHDTHAGLMAVRKLIHLGSGGGAFDHARDIGRRTILPVLHDYGQAREFPEIIRYLDGGNFDPEIEVTLRKLSKDLQVAEENRLYARFVLARLSLKFRRMQQYWESRLKELQEGQATYYPGEKESLLNWQALAKSEKKLDQLEREALQTLETLSTTSSKMRQPAVTHIDDDWHIIVFDPEQTKTKPTLKAMAAGLLFKERHLQEGQPAPDLKLKLVSGKDWSLAEQRGKAVIIQFSFKGCGPCEAMYPDLHELKAKYKDKLVILGIMADEERKDTLDAVASGKLTWNVHWDNYRGPIATKWAVRGFPTVYIIGPDGRIAAKQLRGEKLKAKIAELTR